MYGVWDALVLIFDAMHVMCRTILCDLHSVAVDGVWHNVRIYLYMASE